MSFQSREGRIIWVKDLNASTATTAFPVGPTAGVPLPANMQEGRSGGRIHVMARHAVASGTVSLFVSVYGYTAEGAFTAGGWTYLGSFNNNAPMAADGSRWSPDISTIATSEVFSMSGANYQRLATRQIAPGGSSPTTDTYIGFPQE